MSRRVLAHLPDLTKLKYGYYSASSTRKVGSKDQDCGRANGIDKRPSNRYNIGALCRSGGMVDAEVSKTFGGNLLGVRVPSSAPN